MSSVLPKLKRIPLKDRVSMIFLERGELDVIDGAFVLVDRSGVRTHIPVGSVACLLLEPGSRVSHAAAVLAARVGCLLIWVGEAAVRLYAAGMPGGARSDRLLYQARLALDEGARLRVVRKMYELRFGEPPPAKRSVDQLRGIEGHRVRDLYRHFAQRYGVEWHGRDYDRADWEGSDPINTALSSATACLYGVTHAAVLAAGYSPSIGFIHSGKPLSFVYDVADLVKFETVVPIAFQIAAGPRVNYDRMTRLGCRDAFRQSRLLERLIPLIEEVLDAGGLAVPQPADDCQPVAFQEPEEV